MSEEGGEERGRGVEREEGRKKKMKRKIVEKDIFGFCSGFKPEIMPVSNISILKFRFPEEQIKIKFI